MNQKTHKALKWIIGILDDNNITYQIGGGLATNLYGSVRPVNDIDISLSGKYFPVIIPLVREHTIAGPKQYLSEKWDCTTLSLNYHGQDIDITDVDTLLMRNKAETEWIKNKEIYEKHPPVAKEADGVRVVLMDPRVLLEYKNELNGEHQNFDRKFLASYIKSNQIEIDALQPYPEP